MKTKNIFRMLLVAAALLMGANNVKATETIVWEGKTADYYNGDLQLSYSNFTSKGLAVGQILRVYASDFANSWSININSGWSNSLGFGNWKGDSDGKTIRNTNTDAFDNTNGYFEMTIGEDFNKVENEGFRLQCSGLYVTKITLYSGGGSSKTTPILSFGEGAQETYNITFGDSFTGPTATCNIDGLEVTYTSSETSVAEVGTFSGEVNIKKAGTTIITAQTQESTDYNAASISYTLIIATVSETYTVSVSAGSNGSAYVDKQNAASGEKVTITTVPNSGYRVSSVTVTGGVSVSEETANTTYSFTMPANNVTVNVTFELETQGTPDQLVIGNTGYATYSNAENAINLSGLSGVKAYIATAISLEQNKVTLTQVSGVVAANTGLIFISENKQPGTFNLPIASSTGTTYNNNLLLPSYANTTLSPSDAWYTYYVLVQRENNSVKFAEVYSYDAQPGAGKAYLRTSKNQASARTRGLSIEINDGTTGINAVENEQGENVIYNLRGQRVENPTKGLYIINGKKVLIK